MKRLLSILAVLSIGLVVFLNHRSSPDGRFANASPPNKHTIPADRTIETPIVSASSHREFAPEPAIKLADFRSRFGLDDVQMMDLDACINRVKDDWLEMKGAHAQVLSCDGKRLKMFVPGMHLSDQQIISTIRKHLARSFDRVTVEKIWTDPIARESLIFSSDPGFYSLDLFHTFTKKNEDPPRPETRLNNYPMFDVELQLGNAVDDRLPSVRISHGELLYGFSYFDANVVYSAGGIGWNAMAKAPTGYFRNEPILGVQSRPKGLPYVIEDLVSGEAEIRGERFPGSKDVMLPDGTIQQKN